MAINFLNSIDLNQNEILQGVIENQPNDAAAGASPIKGQLYFNTTSNILKQYNGTSWEEVGGGVETVTTTDGTYINLTPNSATAGAVTVTADLSAADGTAIAATRFLTKDNTWATVPQGDITEVQGGTYISVANQTGPIPVVNHDATSRTDTSSSASPGYGATFTAVDSVTSNATGHITALNLKTVTMPSAEAYTFNVTGDSGTNQVINSGNTLDIAGGTNITTVVGATDTVTVNLNDSITLTGSLTVDGVGTFNDDVSFDANVSITGDLDMNTAKIIDLGTPTSATDAATKGYVDQAVTGALSYQGGYNAATNTPNLDSNPSPNPIKKGWTYTVTAAGSFFTEQVRVGDVLIAEQDAPTALADWTTAQNNVDLADLTTVGLGNVNAGEAIDVSYSNGTATVSVENSTASNKGAVIVAPGGAIDVSYTSGTATVSVEDSTASNKGAVIVAGGTGISVAYSNGTATVTNTETNADNSYAVTITDTATITHSLGTKDVMIQLYDVTTNETVYADVERGSTTQATITFAATPTNSVRVLVQKIG